MDQTERSLLLESWRLAVQTLALRAQVTLAETDWPAVWQNTVESAEAIRAKQLAQLAQRLSNHTQSETQPSSDQLTAVRLPNMLATIVRSNNGTDTIRQRRTHERFHPLRALELTQDFLFPSETTTNADYADLWQGLWSALNATDPADVTSVLAILKRFTWAVPAALSGAGADVSLYEQTRSAAALSICWHRAGWPVDAQLTAPIDQQLGWLVKGDLSGVQDFLYMLTSAGAARGLRGRSFYLQLLTETIAEWSLRRWDQTPTTNLLYAGGGHFYLLLPVGAANDETQWRELQRKLAEKLWNAHRGDLGCTLARVELNVCDLTTPGRLAERWTELAQASSAQKERKWSELGSTAMFERLFTPQQRGTTAEEMCQICQHDFDEDRDGHPAEGEPRKCSRCRGFEELGRKLRDVQHLVRFNVGETAVTGDIDWEAILGSFGQTVELAQDGEPMPPAPAGTQNIIVERVNEWWQPNEQELFENAGCPTQYGWRWLADAIPCKRDEQNDYLYDFDNRPDIAEFSDLSVASQGVPWLGVLRMDVDNLGEVLRDGLQGAASLARLSTLSETLRLYFEGWVPQLCKKYNQGQTALANGDAAYLIYAGGDDLFVVGGWSILPRLAREIHDDFADFVGGQHITISAGIAIEHAKYPLYQFADDARVALDDHAKGLRPIKDAICFLQTTLGWEQFGDVNDWHNRLLAILADGMPRSLLTRLSEIHASYAENAQKQRSLATASGISPEQIKEQIQYARWQWRLVYQLSQTSERNAKHKAELTALQEALVRDDKLIGLLRVLARWTELQSRNPQPNE
ncbi:MAG: type III-A CRISPR-associated protein Cas10/Csm1 [Acidobacteria bacterium]|nr:type III-A CRISPR-associated protein Cas10/Csm1 [Acidobacteriota bacterium]